MMKKESDRFIYMICQALIFLFYVLGLFCVLGGIWGLCCVGIFLLGEGVSNRNRAEFLRSKV